VPNRAAGYNVNDDGKLANQWYASSTFLRTGDGAIYVSARDMVTWGLALRNNKILSADEYRLLTTASPQSLNDESGGYGMGMSLSKSGPHTIHAHGGSWQGFLSYFMRVVDEDVIVSINANSSGYRTEEAAHKIASLWAPQLDRL
jgi:CubicO group peptidase (beta-lactamase class C family)